jgi:hypothetical protein
MSNEVTGEIQQVVVIFADVTVCLFCREYESERTRVEKLTAYATCGGVLDGVAGCGEEPFARPRDFVDVFQCAKHYRKAYYLRVGLDARTGKPHEE